MTTASTEAKRKTGDSTKTAALNKYGDDMPVIERLEVGCQRAGQDTRHLHQRGQCVGGVGQLRSRKLA